MHVHVPAGVAAYLPGTGTAAAAAVFFAVGSVLQHEAASSSTSERGLDLRRLVSNRVWVAGQSATVIATLLQVVALALAPVAIVQPLLAGALVVALGIRSVRERCLPSGTELLGAVCTCGGLAVFLAAARPAAGEPERLPSLLAVIVAVLVAVGLVVLVSRTKRGPREALTCGAAAGIAAGIAAVLISAAMKALSERGIVQGLTYGALWAALIVAVTAQWGSQQAYSRGALSWSLPALILLDPLSAVPGARFLLGERLAPGHSVIWGPAAALAVLGVILLARADETCRRPLRLGRRPPGTEAG
ncbi:MAG: DMT family transporter [Kutzneria sp.]|nr:DMT family transporter [Kutzneria sp.]MBV9847550.1 DMT family transporter [Kutzneria sp.]